MKHTYKALLVFLICLLGSFSHAQTVQVGGDGRFATAAGLLSGNTLWVDGLNGSDTSGRTNDFSKKYRSIGAAKTNAISGDTIVVLPYAYTEHDLMKAGVRIHFLAGATVSWTVPTNTDAGLGIFDDRAPGASGSFAVTGDGEFQLRNSNPTCATAYGAIMITNAATSVNIRGKRIVVSTRNTGFINAICVLNCQPSFFDFDELTDTFELWSDLDASPSFIDSNANGVYWGAGDVHIRARKSRFVSGYCLWPDEPTGGTTNSLWYRGETLYTTNITAIYGRSSSGGYRTWVEALEIIGSSAINLSGPGKFYITAQKIAASSGTGIAITSSAETWITAQKISGGGGGGNVVWVWKPVNSGFVAPQMHVTAQQYEDTGSGANPGIVNDSTNNLYIHGGYIRAAASGANLVKHAGTGSTYLDDVVVDGTLCGASGWPVTVSSNGLVLRNTTIIGSSSVTETIHSTAGSPIVEVQGASFANRAVGSIVLSNGWLQVSNVLQSAQVLGYAPSPTSFMPAQVTLFQQGIGGTAYTNITAAETSILGAVGKGSKTLPALTLLSNRVVTFKASGRFWSSAATPNTTFYFKLGSTVIAQRNFTSLTSRLGAAWEAELTVRCATNGATGAVSSDGFLKIEGSSLFGVTNTMTVLDITPALAFDFTGTNTTTTMSFLCDNARLELYP